MEILWYKTLQVMCQKSHSDLSNISQLTVLLILGPPSVLLNAKEWESPN